MVGWFIYAVCEPCLQALFINPASLTCDNLSSVLPIISGEVLAHNAGRPPRRKGHRGQHRAGLLHPGRFPLARRARRRTGRHEHASIDEIINSEQTHNTSFSDEIGT